MVNLTINGKKVSVKEGTTILDAAKSIGETIPTLCYLKEINEIGACRVCVVEVEGTERCVTACNNFVEEGMVVYTNSRKVRTTRKTNVKLILSQHDYKCGTCVRSGNCTLQSLANELNISEMPYDSILEKDNWDMTFPLIRNAQKCIKCMRCVQICDNIQEMHIWDVVNTGSRISCRAPEDAAPFKAIPDEVDRQGPFGGVYSALRRLQKPILVLSCDLPFMDGPTLRRLLDAREARLPGTIMTTYQQEETGFIEALVAVYEPACLPWFDAAWKQGIRKFSVVIPEELRTHVPYSRSEALPFFNINYPADFEIARRLAELMRRDGM